MLAQSSRSVTRRGWWPSNRSMVKLSGRLMRRRVAVRLALTLALAGCATDSSGPIADSSGSGPVSQAGEPKPSGSTSTAALVGAALFVDPASRARQTADAWRATRPADAAQMDKIAAAPQAQWFGN